MKKVILLTYFVFFQLLLVTAQSKVNFAIAQQIQKKNTAAIDVFIKGDVNRIKELIETNGGKFKRSAGNIVIANLTFPQIAIFLKSNGVERIEAYPQRTIPMNDTMLINNNVIPVHNGQSPLIQAYDGKGVVVGIIDTGLDFTHPDFIDSTGRSRVKFYWDQTKPYNGPYPPNGFDYGQEWDNIQIDSGKAIPGTDPHGTHVTGIAAGNGRAVNKYKGVAPAADIVAVSLDFKSDKATLVTDAVEFIYARAQLLGEPCVINASIGDYMGSHDGTDLQAQYISSLIDQKAGRAFVASAGNKGNSPIHLGYTVTSDTNFTFFSPSQGVIDIIMWGDTAAFKNINFAIGADEVTPAHSFRGRTAFTTITPNLGLIRYDTLFNNNGKRLGIVGSYGDVMEGDYSMEYFIIPDSMSYAWRLITTGSGKFDAWNTDNIFIGTLPSSTVMKDSVFYKKPDLNQTIVSSYQCLNNVITVGNYSNRKMYIDYNHNPYYSSGTPGKRFPTSSCGPTRDGRIKPDIIAPGDAMLSSLVLSLRTQYIAIIPTALTPEAYHVRDGGTSSAGPGVAGIAALYLQKYPTATAMQVKNAILGCARQDVFTNGTPNNSYGYGKADAFKTLTGCGITGIDANNNETVSLRIYPNPANNGSTIHVDVSLPSGMSIQRLEIYNEMGARVLMLNAPKAEIELTKQLAPGIYFCKLISNTHVVATKKLVIL
jgi:subtilisin family serine protease